MSTEDILSRVKALYRKVIEVEDKGHLPRAAELYGRVADAARGLGVDNLVMLEMQLRQGIALAAYGTNAIGEQAPSILAANLATFVALLTSAIEALERRRVADTLLDGNCCAAETAWYSWLSELAASRDYLTADCGAAAPAALVGTTKSCWLAWAQWLRLKPL